MKINETTGAKGNRAGFFYFFFNVWCVMRKKNEWCWKRNRQKIEIESNTRLDDRENRECDIYVGR